MFRSVFLRKFFNGIASTPPLSEVALPVSAKPMLVVFMRFTIRRTQPRGLHLHIPHRERKNAAFYHVMQSTFALIYASTAIEKPPQNHCFHHELHNVKPENEPAM